MLGANTEIYQFLLSIPSGWSLRDVGTSKPAGSTYFNYAYNTNTGEFLITSITGSGLHQTNSVWKIQIADPAATPLLLISTSSTAS